jgi:hypothetical protein
VRPAQSLQAGVDVTCAPAGRATDGQAERQFDGQTDTDRRMDGQNESGMRTCTGNNSSHESRASSRKRTQIDLHGVHDGLPLLDSRPHSLNPNRNPELWGGAL